MKTTPGGDEQPKFEIVKSGEAIEALTRAEIDVQIATAHRFPRDIATFQMEAKSLVTADAETAESCFYALPRGGGYIEGESVRFAEIAASAYGNLLYGSRIIAIEEKFVVAQGVAHDLQKNVKSTAEVRRRITDKNGNRFNDDMVNITCNAACAIAKRNAILTVIPKALLKSAINAAVKLIAGDIETLPDRRQKALDWFAQQGIKSDVLCAYIGVGGEASIDLKRLVVLGGIKTALEEGGELTVKDILDAVNKKGMGANDPDAIKTALNKVSTAAKKPEPKPAESPKSEPAAASSDDQELTEENAPAIVEKMFAEALPPELVTAITPHLKALKLKDAAKATFRHVLKLDLPAIAEVCTSLQEAKEKRVPAESAKKPEGTPREQTEANLKELFAKAAKEDLLTAKSATGAKGVTEKDFLILPDDDLVVAVLELNKAAKKRAQKS